MMSPGKIAQPPQAIGSSQPTKVRPLTEAGAATPAHQIGSFEASTPALSRITPSVTSAVTLRFIIRMREDVAEDAGGGDAHGVGDRDAAFRHGLDRAAGRDRLRPAFRRREILAHRHEAHREGRPDDAPPPEPSSGIGPCIQQRRMPFFSSIVVMVPVVTFFSLS